MGEGLFVGGLEPAEGAEVFDAGGFQGEDDFGEVEAFDFGEFLCGAVGVLVARPEAEAEARGGAAGAAGALVGGGAADLLDEQGVDAAIRVVARDAGQAAVNDEADAVNGEGGFGDVGGDDDFALVVAGDGGVLVAGGKLAVQGEQAEPAGFGAAAEGFDGLGDLVAAGHEDQDVALAAGADEVGESLGGLVPDGAFVEVGGCGGELDFDGVGAAVGFEQAAGAEVLLEGGGVERGGHDEELEVGPGVCWRSSARARVMSP